MNDVSGEHAAIAAFTDTPIAQLVSHPCVLSLQALGRLQSESLRFIAARSAKDIAFALHCSPFTHASALFGLGASFAMEAADDYLREGMKLFAIAAGTFESSTSALI